MVISVASQKGGTGKTSTSVSLAAGLAHKGKRVLLIDIDSQANSSKVLLRHYAEITKDQTIHHTILDRGSLVIHETHVPNLSIVPSHIRLSNTDIELTTAKDHRESRLKTELDKIKQQYDFIFIDNPPALGWLTLNAFTASDKVLVVVSPGYFELDSLVQLGRNDQATLTRRRSRAVCGLAPPASRVAAQSLRDGLRPPLTPETAASPTASIAGRRGACPFFRAATVVMSDGVCPCPAARGRAWLSFMK